MAAAWHFVGDNAGMAAPVNTSRRALIVEDEPAIREIVRLHLSLAEFQTEEVADGRFDRSRQADKLFRALETVIGKRGVVASGIG